MKDLTFKWLDLVFLKTHFPCLDLLYFEQIDLYCKTIITHVLHTDYI